MFRRGVYPAAIKNPIACFVLLLTTVAAFVFPELTAAQTATKYQYFRLGSPQDAKTTTQAGFALMGGGTDLDEAFRWMCERAHGGDFLILRASGTDAYNPYVQKLCSLNSVATLILPNREAANDPFAAATIDKAEAVFIAGGDQANYINFWLGTRVQAAVNGAIRRGVPVGGTSAGLAVMGEWAYSAQGDKPDDPNLDAKTALMNPLGPRVSLVHGFLEIPVLKDIITDSHFAKRERMGRLLVFLARIQSSGEDPHIRGIGIDERTAVLVEPDGAARVVGQGNAFFVLPFPPAAVLHEGKPLNQANFFSMQVKAGGEFNIKNCCYRADSEDLTVEDGRLRSFKDRGPVE
jgi:cyanophycinase